MKTGLDKLLGHYGLSMGSSYVLDENCYKQRIPLHMGGGERPIYYAPIVKNERINKHVPFLRNIKGLVLLKASPVRVDAAKVKAGDLRARLLFSSSDRSWELKDRIDLNPLFLNPPADPEVSPPGSPT